jgi:NAD(P)-dependent dehydrogenase (short-subunit alcohol dehydrogenase family)
MGHDLLAGMVALVTGAGQGLGAAIAREYAAEGASVALLDRNADTLRALSAELRGAGAAVVDVTVDITDQRAVAEAMGATLAHFGQVDVLVNNAGIFSGGTILEDTLDDWRRVLGVNLDALYLLTKRIVPHMVTRRYGRIINIASIAGFVSRGNVGSYNASKGAVIAFTKSLAVELAPYGILANAIAPGFLRTAQMQDAQGQDLTQSADFIGWYVQRRHIPMARAGEPGDVAGTAVFLASAYCRYLTGQVLIVDGGLTSTF